MNKKLKTRRLHYILILTIGFTLCLFTGTGCSTESKSMKAVRSYDCRPPRKASNPIYKPTRRKSSSNKAIQSKNYPPPKDYRIKRHKAKYLYPKR